MVLLVFVKQFHRLKPALLFCQITVKLADGSMALRQGMISDFGQRPQIFDQF
jgi:hypothetical protein